MGFQILMFESGKIQYYVTIYNQFYLNSAGVCNVHYYISDNWVKDELQIQHHCRSWTCLKNGHQFNQKIFTLSPLKS